MVATLPPPPKFKTGPNFSTSRPSLMATQSKSKARGFEFRVMTHRKAEGAAPTSMSIKKGHLWRCLTWSAYPRTLAGDPCEPDRRRPTKRRGVCEGACARAACFGGQQRFSKL